MTTEPAVSHSILSPSRSISRRHDVIACAVAEETVLLDLASGIYFGLDPVGSTIWEMLAVPRRIEEIRDELLKEYEIAPDLCEKHVLQFLAELSKRELIVLDAIGE